MPSCFIYLLYFALIFGGTQLYYTKFHLQKNAYPMDRRIKSISDFLW
jgi:hypothetical protein